MLEIFKPGDIAKLLFDRVVLKQTALLDDLLFLAEHDADIIRIQRAAEHQCFGKDVFGLLQRQTLRGMNQALTPRGIQADLHLRLVFHILDDPIEQRVEFLHPRWAKFY